MDLACLLWFTLEAIPYWLCNNELPHSHTCLGLSLAPITYWPSGELLSWSFWSNPRTFLFHPLVLIKSPMTATLGQTEVMSASKAASPSLAHVMALPVP